MNAMIFYLLIFMFFLRLVQVGSAIVIAIGTRREEVRMRFGNYLAGVVLYFLVMLGIWQIPGFDHTAAYPALPIFVFFAGAFALAVYHIHILILSFGRGRNLDPQTK